MGKIWLIVNNFNLGELRTLRTKKGVDPAMSERRLW